MVRWGDPATEALLATINGNATFLLLGLFGWEFFHTLDVEYAVIRGRLSLCWPLIPYLLGRLTLLATLLLLTVEQASAPIFFACQSGVTSSTVLGDITLACCSTNLMIRTWVIWKNSRLVHILLLVTMLGHWTLLALDAINMRASTSNGFCAPYIMQTWLGTAVFGYTMFYDLLVFVLSIVKLSRQPCKSPLGKCLRSQGIHYFAVAVVVNIVPTVFSFLDSESMLAIVSCFATTTSTIVSCRAVRSFFDFRKPPSSPEFDEGVEPEVSLTTEFSITQFPSMIPTST